VKRLAALAAVVSVLAPWPTSASTPEPGTILRVRVRTDAELLAALDTAAVLSIEGDYATALAFIAGAKKWTEAQALAQTTTVTTVAP
jgi:hypothetical protein